jgi:Protein of unknown function (DUF3179)
MTNDDSFPAAETVNPADSTQRLFTFKSGGWVLLLAGLMTLIAAALVLYPVYTTGGFHRLKGDGHNIDTYGFDLSNLIIPKDHLIAAGVQKDQIQAIPQSLVETITPEQVTLIAKNEYIRFLVPGDEVIGVEIKGEFRAYPIRVLTLHQLINDTLGGTPIAVTYSPLSDSVVVFDRRIDSPTASPAEFGVSGLLVSANSVFFDRRNESERESLWPQLGLKAISGPCAGKAMTLIPYELTTWQDWTGAHPNTRVLQGLRTLKARYGDDPYSTYRASDDLKGIPVSPLWDNHKIRLKARVVLTSSDRIHWDANIPSVNIPSAPYRIYSYVFAWYAQHSQDTDYAALK